MMDFLSALRVSASGLTAQRTRINLVASNLANAETTRTPEGGPYRRRDPLLAAVPLSDSFEDALDDAMGEQVHEVEVVGVSSDTNAPRRVYDPGHPDADGEGFVNMPNVEVVGEMVNMVTASRTYEANATAISTIKQMAQMALSIGT
jgi:flagellar basal-body rod protein FlgC